MRRLLTSIVDSNGNTTTLAYSDQDSDSIADELVSITDPFSRVTSINYMSGKVMSVAHHSGRTTTLSYSGASLSGYTLPDPDGAGYTTTYAYNGQGLPTSITTPDPDGAGALSASVTGLAYDSYGRVTTITNPDSSTQTFTYNGADQTLTSVDELSKTITHVFDSLGRFTSVTNRVSAQTQFRLRRTESADTQYECTLEIEKLRL